MRDRSNMEGIGRARRRHLEARVDALMAADDLPVEHEAVGSVCRALVALTRRSDDVAALQELFIEAALAESRAAWWRGVAAGAVGALACVGLGVALTLALA